MVLLAAAHCVTKQNANHPMNPDLFLVYLGKYHLKQWSEEGMQDKQVAACTLQYSSLQEKLNACYPLTR